MKAILDRLLWVPYVDVDAKRIMDDMTVEWQPFKGPSKSVKLYELRGDLIGVPRRWGLKALREYGLEIEDRTTFPHISWPKIKFPEGWDYRPGQLDAITCITRAFEEGEYGGLLEAPCGAGKTLMAMDVAARLNTPALIMVHKNDLAEQWHRTAFGYPKEGKPALWPGINAGHVQQDSLKYKNCHFVTAMAQTLYARMDTLPEDFWDSFGVVIYDEGHRYPAETFEYVLRRVNARKRLGISATWRRSDGLDCVWHWHIGSVIAKPRVIRLTGEYVQVLWKTALTDKMFRHGSYISAANYITAISENTAYNNWLIEQFVQSSAANRKMLVVTDRVDHCMNLRSLYMKRMVDLGKVPDVGLYIGGGKLSKIELEASKKKQLIIGTYPMIAEGTDVPDIDTLLLATPKTDIEQVVGRIQRPHGDKKRLLVVDPVFDTPWNRKMAEKRVKIYEELDFMKQE